MDDRKIRLVALDLDGTLLDSRKRLSPRNRDALARVAAQGVHVVPTTGRFFGGIPDEVRALPFVRYAITVNGAAVYDRREDAVLSRVELPLATALAAIEALEGFDLIYDCYQDNWGWMSESMQRKAVEYAPDEHYLKMIREQRHAVPDLKAHLAAKGADVQKVMCFVRDLADIPAVKAAVAARCRDVAISQAAVNNVEINDSHANKGEALARLAGALGFGLGNCMSFGDGLNDLSMVEAAGLGVAMANARDEVKAVADFVGLSNDEDGVADALDRFVPVRTSRPRAP